MSTKLKYTRIIAYLLRRRTRRILVFYSSLTLLCNGQSFKILPHSLVAPPSFLVYNKFHISFDLQLKL
jgi:hypothetical protein